MCQTSLTTKCTILFMPLTNKYVTSLKHFFFLKHDFSIINSYVNSLKEPFIKLNILTSLHNISQSKIWELHFILIKYFVHISIIICSSILLLPFQIYLFLFKKKKKFNKQKYFKNTLTLHVMNLIIHFPFHSSFCC